MARGFRGGERQTELLIRGLAERGVHQRLIARKSEPLIERLADLPSLERFAVTGIVSATFALRDVALAHAHEGRCVQAAALAHQFRKTPYVVTRRVTRPLSDRAITQRMYRRAAALVGLSSRIACQLEDFSPEQEAYIIPSAFTPIAPDPTRTEELLRQFGSKPIVGHVGALVSRHKGQPTLIEAARQRPNIQFVFVGSGDDERTLRCQATGLKNIHFVGEVVDVASYMATFDVFAFPSLFEGLGSILLDAMYLQLPIVASDVDGIPDIIQHEINGLLVPPSDPPAMVAAIDRLLSDEVLRKQFATRNREIINDFSVSAMTDRYFSLYEKILGNVV